MRWFESQTNNVKATDYRDRILKLEKEFRNEEVEYLKKIRELKVNTAKDTADIVEELFLAKHPNLAIGCTISHQGRHYKLLDVTFKFDKPNMIAVMGLQPLGFKSLPHIKEMYEYSFKVVEL